MRPQPIAPGPGQESVWDYPRPPRLEPCGKRIEIHFNGQLIATTTAAYRVLETSHPPVYYLPPGDIRMEWLQNAGGASFCEWKGSATYHDVVVGAARALKAAWSYPNPTARFAAIKDHIAFYAQRMERCTVDGVEVTPQPGGFYGGWITPELVGPFKGAPGTQGW